VASLICRAKPQTELEVDDKRSDIVYAMETHTYTCITHAQTDGQTANIMPPVPSIG